jgi:Protein of unknown function (DUF4011)
LLDLGLRNSLLNYRPSRARGVELIDELLTEVFRILVRERKSMTFRPAPEDTDPEAEQGELLAQPGDEGEDGSCGGMAQTSIRRLCTTGPTNFQP